MTRIGLMIGYDWMRATLLVLAVLLTYGTSAHAMKFSPIEMSFSPSGRESVRTFRLENDTDKAVAVEISIFSRVTTLDGSDELESAADDFVIIPEQIVLNGGDVQWIRVQWIGNPRPDAELAFRLIVEQLPIDIGDQPEVEGGIIRLLVRFLASVYVVPRGVAADISVVSAVQATGPADRSMLLVELHNSGTEHKILDGVHLTITSLGNQESATITLSAEDLARLGGRNILAGATRRLKLTWPEGLPPGPVAVSLDASAL